MIYWLILFTLITAPAHAADWSITDKVLLGSYTLAWAADWGQTRYMATHPDEFYEKNNLLGKHPSLSEVDIYFAGMYLLNLFIADKLGPAFRKIYLGAFIYEHGRCTINNKSIGIKFNFSLK